MASFTAGTTFSDGVANDVTAAKLGALVTNATPTSGFIQDRTAETVIASNDTVLIGDASDSNNLKRMTVDNLMKAEMTGNINSTSGTIQTLTSSTATITSGTIGGLFNGSLNTTSGTIGTFNSTTATIPTLTSTTLITSGTGTASAPAIVPTGDTNNGLFFPAADTIAVSTNGTERVRVDSSGNVGIGTNIPAGSLHIHRASANNIVRLTTGGSAYDAGIQFGDAGESTIKFCIGQNDSFFSMAAGGTFGASGLGIDSSGNVGIGTTTPSTYGLFSAIGSSNGFQNITFVNSSTGASAVSRIQIGNDASNGAGQILMYGSQHSSLPNVMDINNATNSSLRLLTNNTERLRIGSAGQIGIGGANYGTSGQVLTSNGTGSAPSWQANTPADGTITYAKLSTSATEADNVSKRVAKAWVNFNGTGTVAIRDDFNVSSVTDEGTGDYTINFVTTISNSNYCVLSSGASVNPSSSDLYTFGVRAATAPTTSSVRMIVKQFGSSLVDATYLNMAVFSS